MTPAWETLELVAKAVLTRQAVQPAQVTVLRRKDGSDSGAGLVSIARDAPFLLLPLGFGTNWVGRSEDSDYGPHRRALTGIVEGAQWRIVLGPTLTTVADAGSTNGSVLVRRKERDNATLELTALLEASIGERLGWDGASTHAGAPALFDGDVLVNAYGSFLYCNAAL